MSQMYLYVGCEVQGCSAVCGRGLQERGRGPRRSVGVPDTDSSRRRVQTGGRSWLGLVATRIPPTTGRG